MPPQKKRKKLPTPHQAIIKTDGIIRVNPAFSLAMPNATEGRQRTNGASLKEQAQGSAAI